MSVTQVVIISYSIIVIIISYTVVVSYSIVVITTSVFCCA